MKRREIALRMEGLVVFRGLLRDPVVDAFVKLMECEGGKTEQMRRYGTFCAALFAHTEDWSGYLQ